MLTGVEMPKIGIEMLQKQVSMSVKTLDQVPSLSIAAMVFHVLMVMSVLLWRSMKTI
jgi:hypothetical protein